MRIVLSSLAIVFLAQLTFAGDAKKSWSTPPEMKIDPAKQYNVTIDTNKGSIVLTLFAKDAPKSVNSFVFLAREGFYDGLIFHRVMPGFMIQGGCPQGTGMGGPGYEFENENKSSTHGFVPGTLAMANGGPDTNGSQFFICQGPDAERLAAANYTIFGKVTEGQNIVSAIANEPRNRDDKPLEAVVMKSVKIEEK